MTPTADARTSGDLDARWSLELGSQLVDGAAIAADRLHVLAHGVPRPEDPTRTIVFSLHVAASDGSSKVETFEAVDGSAGGAIHAAGDTVLAAWLEHPDETAHLRLVRRGRSDDEWSLALPPDAIAIGVPVIAENKAGGWTVCVGTIDEAVLCRDIAAESSAGGDWRTLRLVAGLVPSALAATTDATWLVAACETGSCDQHVIAVTLDAAAPLTHDLGRAAFPAVAAMGGDLFVVGDAADGSGAAWLVTRGGVRDVALGSKRVLDVVPGNDGVWLVDAYGWRTWTAHGGVGPQNAWPAPLIERIGGNVQSVRAGGAGAALLVGLRPAGLTAVGVRFTP